MQEKIRRFIKGSDGMQYDVKWQCGADCKSECHLIYVGSLECVIRRINSKINKCKSDNLIHFDNFRLEKIQISGIPDETAMEIYNVFSYCDMLDAANTDLAHQLSKGGW